jgi:hypothetical protein
MRAQLANVSDDEFSSVKLFSTSEIRRATSSFYVVKMHCFVSLIAILARLADLFDLGLLDQSVRDVEELHDEHDR